jgi:hypothetical protein
LAELAESVPIDGIPQLRPLQAIRMLRNPYIARRFLNLHRSKSIAFPELSRLFSLLVASLLTGSSVSLSFFSLIISQVPFLAGCTSLPVFPFSQTHLSFIPILAICFGSFHHYGPLPTRLSYTHSCSCRNCILWDCLFPWSSCNIHTYHRCR